MQKPRHSIFAFSVLLFLANATIAGDPPKGFETLFNRKDMTGWHGMPRDYDPYKLDQLKPNEVAALFFAATEDALKHWKVENGELVNDGDGAYLTTDREFGDMELLLEYKTVPRADSGIYLRATPQVQIWDYTDPAKKSLDADKGSGGLWNNSKDAPGKNPLVLADKPLGEWNKFRIIQIGERTTVYLNDKLVVDHARMENYWNRKLPLRRKGPIELQTHGGEIRWRNIFVREIPSSEANDILRKHGSTGFVDVFNGKDFAGWSGATANYEVKDGALVCRQGKGGNIFTNDQYGDFIARLEYRLPAGGNNGLAIRYPGKNDAAYGGMCEIQILDDDSAQYKTLDKRQFNGSAYGMAAAHRGYLRPTGEWNFMDVTVRGSTIQIELNGTRILDVDLSKITDYMGNKPHPGKDRKAGHFGFCGHSDPVAFRGVQIRRVDSN